MNLKESAQWGILPKNQRKRNVNSGKALGERALKAIIGSRQSQRKTTNSGSDV